MRMTDETPRVNHSFALRGVHIFSADKTARRLGNWLSEELVSMAGLMKEASRPPDER